MRESPDLLLFFSPSLLFSSGELEAEVELLCWWWTSTSERERRLEKTDIVPFPIKYDIFYIYQLSSTFVSDFVLASLLPPVLGEESAARLGLAEEEDPEPPPGASLSKILNLKENQKIQITLSLGTQCVSPPYVKKNNASLKGFYFLLPDLP